MKNAKLLLSTFIVLFAYFSASNTLHAKEPAIAGTTTMTTKEALELLDQLDTKLEEQGKKLKELDKRDANLEKKIRELEKLAAEAEAIVEESWRHVLPAPLETVEGHVNRLIAVLSDGKRPSMEDKEQKASIRTITDSLFDFSKCSHIALGKRMKRKFTADQLKSYEALYRELLENHFIGALKQYGAQKVVSQKGIPDSPTKVEVKTKLPKINGAILDRYIHYYLFYEDSKWKVYNIAIGMNDLGKAYNFQFRAFLAERSPEELIEKIRAVVEKQKASAH